MMLEVVSDTHYYFSLLVFFMAFSKIVRKTRVTHPASIILFYFLFFFLCCFLYCLPFIGELIIIIIIIIITPTISNAP